MKVTKSRVIIAITLLLMLIVGSCSIENVPAGHVKVGSLFGKVQDKAITEGMNFVNPLKSWTKFDGRQKTLKITAEVPSRDQLTTKFDLSVQYRMKKSMASLVLKETGNVENTVEVHMVPSIRSLIREEGKAVEKAEDFFKDEIQRGLQKNLILRLKDKVGSKGLEVQDILIRDVNLPQFIVHAIEKKKEREQEAEKEVAELKRFKTEQEKKLAAAEADFAAAQKAAETKKVRADAQAYENIKLAKSITPSLVKWKYIERWDGKLSHVSGGNTPFINLK